MDSKAKIESFVAQRKSDFLARAGDGVLLPGKMPFVTITSQSGAGGHRFAKSLYELIERNKSHGEVLSGWRIFDKDMCQELLEREHLADSLRDLLDEDYHSQIDEFVMGILGDQGMQNVAYARLSRLLRTVASVGKVIILGYGSCMATVELTSGLHIRLVAPLSIRGRRMASTLDVDEAQAMKQIRKRDKAQRKLLKIHYRANSADPEHYDLVCNTGRMSPDTAAEILFTLLQKKLG